MIKLLKIREYRDGTTGKPKPYRAPVDQAIVAPTIIDLFANAEEYVSKLPESERYNIHYSLGHWPDKNGKEFESQEVIPFDFDEMDVDRIDEYIPVICSTLGVDEHNVAIVKSGNGLHVIMATTQVITDGEYFTETRQHYKEVCRLLQKSLYEHGLIAKVDTSLWCTGKSLRMPFTKNVKATKGTKDCVLVNGIMHKYDMNIVQMSKLPTVEAENQVAEIAYKGAVDNEAVIQCPFIQHCIVDAEELPEPEWYAMLSVVSRLDNGVKLCHKFSEPYPQYDKAETDAKIEYSINAARPRTCSNISSMWDGCAKCEHFGEITSPIMLKGEEHIESEINGFYYMVLTPEGGEKRGGPCYDDLAKKFIQLYDYVVLHDTLFIYNGKYWYKITNRRYGDMFAEQWFDPTPSNKMCHEFREKLYRIPDRGVDPEFFVTRGLANFQNGYLNTKTGEFLPHDRNIGFTYCLPFDFDEEAECPTFDYFIKDICKGDEGLEYLMIQYMGYVLCAADPNLDPKCMIMTGRGSNGKSTYAELLCALCGDGNWAAVPLLDAVRKAESRIGMVGKLLNFSEEIPTNVMMDNSTFKNLVTGGVFTARNLYKDTIEVRNTAKMIMTCNALPPHNDLSEGMRRRLLIISLKGEYLRPQDFEALVEGEFDSDMVKLRDYELKDKMLVESAGIWNRAYKAYKEMLQYGGFLVPDSVEAEIQGYMDENNIVAVWLNETESIMLTGNEEDYISVSDLYQVFRIDVELLGYERKHVPTKTKFSKTIQQVTKGKKSGAGAKVKRIDGRTTRVLTGIKKI